MTDSTSPIRYSRRSIIAAGAGVALTACTGSDISNTSPSTVDPSNGATGSAGVDPTVVSTTDRGPQLAEAPPYSGSDPFRLGVASGDPDSTSVVLWTRLLPDEPGDDFEATDHRVAWEMSAAPDFEKPVARGLADAPVQHAHSVHVIAENLGENSWYWYRFRIGEFTSTVGRARTAPAPGSLDELRFGFSSCQQWEAGGYAAHRYAAELDDLDLFVWLGDYIYEYGPNFRGVTTEDAGERVHDSAEVDDLDGYRKRYALYRSDPHLQANHAARPWVVTWDDHEVDNNYAGLVAEDDQDTEAFAVRTIAAHQAWWEHMPVRLDPPNGDPLTIYRTVGWGDLVALHMLDGRQYRDPVPTDGEPVPLPGVGEIGVESLGPTALDPDHSMLGADQQDWLIDEIASSAAAWTVLGNQVYMHGITALPGAPAINTDTWDGYFGNRAQLFGRIHAAKSGDLVVISGDFHASTVAALRADPFDQTAPILGTEFMAPAVSSQFPVQLRDLVPLALAVNPHVADFSYANGLMICTVTPERWVTERVDVTDHLDETSTVAPTARYMVEAGVPGEFDLAALVDANA